MSKVTQRQIQQIYWMVQNRLPRLFGQEHPDNKSCHDHRVTLMFEVNWCARRPLQNWRGAVTKQVNTALMRPMWEVSCHTSYTVVFELNIWDALPQEYDPKIFMGRTEPSLNAFCWQCRTYSFFIQTSALKVGSQTKENIWVNCALNLLTVSDTYTEV